MPYDQLTESCFAGSIGEHGLTEDDYAPLLEAAAGGLETLRARRADGGLALLRLPAARDDLADLAPLAERWRREVGCVVVLATGGSSLGGQVLAALAEAGGGPRLDFLDNLDPRSLEVLLDGLDVERTAVLAISKSGRTMETLAQTSVCLEALRAGAGADALRSRCLVVSEPGDSPLRRLAARFDIPTLDHHPDIPGRYSVLSVVGLLPALLAGLDAAAVREGAAEVLEASLAANAPADSAPAVGAALAVALQRRRGIAVSVLMPYADRLQRFALWYRQLWAESLGKGGQGTTPVAALGPVDQHSQLQLYLDGPADKMFTLVAPPLAGRGPAVDGALAGDDDGALAGATIGDVVEAEFRATAETLARRGRPTRILRLHALDERGLGALCMHFMLETILAAGLLGVDPFDQPAVEEVKALTRRYLLDGASP